LDSCDWSCDAGSIDAIWHLEKLWVVRTMPLKVSRCWQFSQDASMFVHDTYCSLHILISPVLKKLYLQMLCRKTCG
jgi:hypothetical protein